MSPESGIQKEAFDPNSIAKKMRSLVDNFPNQNENDGIWILKPRIFAEDDLLQSPKKLGTKTRPLAERNREELEKGRQTPYVEFGNYNPFYRIVEEPLTQGIPERTYSLRFADLSIVPKDDFLYQVVNCRDWEKVVFRVKIGLYQTIITDGLGNTLREVPQEVQEALKKMEEKLSPKK